MPEPLLLSRRLEAAAAPAEATLVLALSAEARQRLRGHCRSVCGRDLLLQLPRGGGPLQPGERLAGSAAAGEQVRVEAATEPLLRVRCQDRLTLLRAAYHLGNRHVALEVAAAELRLLQDPVLAVLLQGLGLQPEAIQAPFHPEAGAYGGHSHASGSAPAGSDSPGDGHSHAHDHGSSPGNGPSPAGDPGPVGKPDPASAEPWLFWETGSVLQDGF
jgi:urease accessory protein